MVGACAWMLILIDDWETESDALRNQAESMGQEIGSVQAGIEAADAELTVLEDQRAAAALRESELAGEAAAELHLTTDIQEVIVDLGQCVADRLQVVRGLWEHGSGYVAALDAQANQDCAAAQTALADLLEETTGS